MLGTVPMPEPPAGMYLIDALFKIGPVQHEAPISWQDLESWERRRGIELAPWQADLLVEMSKAYLGEMYAARECHALPPWPDAVPMWRYVKDEAAVAAKQHQQAIDEAAQRMRGAGTDGNRKRH